MFCALTHLHFAFFITFEFCKIFTNITNYNGIFNPRFDIGMHQIRCRPGLRPGPHWGSLRRSPRPPSRVCSGALHSRLARYARSSLVRTLRSLRVLTWHSVPSPPKSFLTTSTLVRTNNVQTVPEWQKLVTTSDLSYHRMTLITGRC
jgi:hypothetical protein